MVTWNATSLGENPKSVYYYFDSFTIKAKFKIFTEKDAWNVAIVIIIL